MYFDVVFTKEEMVFYEEITTIHVCDETKPYIFISYSHSEKKEGTYEY